MALPWIQGNGADVLTSYFSELTVHTWDLAVATGQQARWDDTVVTAALEAGQILPAENRRALFEEISAAMGLDEVAIPFAEAVPLPGDAPAIDRLVAWNGRDPVADPAARCRFVTVVPPGGGGCRRHEVAGGSNASAAGTVAAPNGAPDSLPNAGHRGCLIAP